MTCKTSQHADSSCLTLQLAMVEAQRCLLCYDPPCSKACPAGTEPGSFLRQLRFLNLEGASRTVLDNNPFGGVCGAVCPVSKLCEEACTREALERPVRIGAVQSFLHAYGIEHQLELPPVAATNGKKVAVIGAGPSGLTAARELVRRGAAVTVFEAKPKAGGTLRYGIAPSRLGDELIDQEVARIESMGVVIKTDSPIAGEEGAKRLLEQGYDAVYLACGLPRGKTVPLPGADLPQVQSALQFLHSANTEGEGGQTYRLVHGRELVVVGGGSVAMDVAVTARRYGAAKVAAVSLEGLDELPADAEEIALAQDHCVVFRPRTRVTRILGSDGKVNGVETIEMEWKEPGLFIPSNALDRAGTEGRLRADAVVFAVGQGFDEAAMGLVQSLSRTQGGWIEADESTQQTSVPRIYAGGDATNGGATVVGAVAAGKRAAQAIMPGVDAPARPLTPSLQTEFCGVLFPNPFCLSSSPVGNHAEMCARAFDAGWGGIYYKTLGLETKHRVYHPSPRLNALHYEGVRAVGLQNVEQITDRPLSDNLKDIEWLRKNYPDRVLCVSIMGFSQEDWAFLARVAEEAGAQILELNFSCPQMAVEGAGHRVGQATDLIELFTAAVKGACSIPVVAKMTPNITDMLPTALAAKRGGADAISAINTLKAITGIDPDGRQPLPNIQGHSSISGFSGTAVRPIGLRFIAEMASSPDLKLPLSGIGGITTWRDALEYLLVGASNVQVTTAIMRFGYRIVEDLADGLRNYMRRENIASVAELVGAAIPKLVDPAQLDHTTEAVSVIDRDLCIGCGQCYYTCHDGANQAIKLDEERKATVDEERCVGCLMCKHICPVEGCISYKIRTRAEFAG
ncbi:MAG: NAD-dependent dihydropyrimidine dehydrogenase subunit PreA [Bradymonadales bacterium]|nr:NAD-dependent dihydropyrimidine dehydrogenase subunit PreA [Bradymonadales bacterium]